MNPYKRIWSDPKTDQFQWDRMLSSNAYIRASGGTPVVDMLPEPGLVDVSDIAIGAGFPASLAAAKRGYQGIKAVAPLVQETLARAAYLHKASPYDFVGIAKGSTAGLRRAVDDTMEGIATTVPRKPSFVPLKNTKYGDGTDAVYMAPVADKAVLNKVIAYNPENKTFNIPHEVNHWKDDIAGTLAKEERTQIKTDGNLPSSFTEANAISNNKYYGQPTEIRARNREMSVAFKKYKRNKTEDNYRRVKKLVGETKPYWEDYSKVVGKEAAKKDLKYLKQGERYLKFLENQGVRRGITMYD